MPRNMESEVFANAINICYLFQAGVHSFELLSDVPGCGGKLKKGSQNQRFMSPLILFDILSGGERGTLRSICQA